MKPTKFLTTGFVAALLFLSAAPLRAAEDRKAMVIDDRTNVSADSRWIYDDLPKGFAEAKRTGKPLLVVLRCIPCEACRMFDEQVVKRESAAGVVMDQFICVRIVSANAMDLALFQWDFDLSFAAFFFNADQTLYGRYGTRSDLANPQKDISMEGFRKSMEAVLALHKNFPANKPSLLAKRIPMRFATPLEYPNFVGKYKPVIDYPNNPVQTCIHCHMVGEAERSFVHKQQPKMPDKNLYPWPMPRVVGLEMNPDERAKIVSVTKGSQADRAGFQPGDEISTFGGQPIISTADLQWVLHNAPESGNIQIQVIRTTSQAPSAAGRTRQITLALTTGWRKTSDLSWRTSTWELRRALLGGMAFDPLTDDERSAAKLSKNDFGLHIKQVGQYAPHDVAKKAGFVKEDILLSFDGITKPLSESEIITYVLENKKAGDKVPATVQRAGKQLKLELTIPGL